MWEEISHQSEDRRGTRSPPLMRQRGWRQAGIRTSDPKEQKGKQCSRKETQSTQGEISPPSEDRRGTGSPPLMQQRGWRQAGIRTSMARLLQSSRKETQSTQGEISPPSEDRRGTGSPPLMR